MNLLRTNKLVLYGFMFVLSSYTFLEMGQGTKTGKNKKLRQLKNHQRQGSVCQSIWRAMGMLNTEYPFPCSMTS